MSSISALLHHGDDLQLHQHATLQVGDLYVFVVPRHHDARVGDRGGTLRNEIKIDVSIISRIAATDVNAGLPTIASDALKELYEQVAGTIPPGRFGVAGAVYLGTDNGASPLYDQKKLIDEQIHLSVVTLRFVIHR